MGGAQSQDIPVSDSTSQLSTKNLDDNFVFSPRPVSKLPDGTDSDSNKVLDIHDEADIWLTAKSKKVKSRKKRKKLESTPPAAFFKKLIKKKLLN